MQEWSEPIVKWARETFGRPTTAKAFERTEQEWREYRESGCCVEEAADVVIMLCSLVATVDDRPLSAFCLDYADEGATPGALWTSLEYWVREQPGIIAIPAARLAMALARSHGGFDTLLGNVRAKMSVNLKRVWRTDGDGVGQHVG